MKNFLKKGGHTKEYFYLFGIFPGNPGEDKRVIETKKGVFVESEYFDEYYFDYLGKYIQDFVENNKQVNIDVRDFPIFETITTTINPTSKLVDITILGPTITKREGIIKEPKFIKDLDETIDPYLNDYLDCVEITEGEFLVGLKSLL